MKIFCERLKELRTEQKLSYKKLGDKLGVRDTTVIRWEKGIILPSIEHLYNLAIFFKVSADYLLGLTNDF